MSGICGNGFIMRYCEDSEARCRYLRVFLLFVQDGERGVWGGRLLRWRRCRAACRREDIPLHLQLTLEIFFELSERGEQCLGRLFRAARVVGEKLLNPVANIDQVELRITKGERIKSRVARIQVDETADLLGPAVVVGVQPS